MVRWASSLPPIVLVVSIAAGWSVGLALEKPQRTPLALGAGASVSLTDVGAVSGTDASAALQTALRQCGKTGGLVHIPSGYWFITATSDLPHGCAGIVGNGDSSRFVLKDYNGAVVRAHVEQGQPFVNLLFQGLHVAGSWSKPDPAFNLARLLLVDGPATSTNAGDGISWSIFRDLTGIAVHDIVTLDTGTVDQGNGLGLGGFSAWNNFEDLMTYSGSQGVTPYAQVFMPHGSSTGNRFQGMTGAVTEAYLRVEGKNCGVGDIVMTTAQVGQGRVLSVGPDTTYRHSIVIDAAQVDAASTEVARFEPSATVPSTMKFVGGSFGGSAPWTGLPPVARTVVSDLGESRWGAGGLVYDNGKTGPVDRNIWVVDLSDGMTVIDVGVDGIVGGVDSGGVTRRFRIAAATIDKTVTISADPAVVLAAHSQQATPFGFPKIGAAKIAHTTKVEISVWYSPNKANATHLESTIVGEGGSFKIMRGAELTY